MVITVPRLEHIDGQIVRADAPPFEWIVADPEPPQQQRRYHAVPAETSYIMPLRFDREARHRNRPLRTAARGTIIVKPVLRDGVICWPDTMTVKPGGQGWLMCEHDEARARYAAANDWKLRQGLGAAP